jgi:hypothetical protein
MKQNLISINQTGTRGILNATEVNLQDINLIQITGMLQDRHCNSE